MKPQREGRVRCSAWLGRVLFVPCNTLLVHVHAEVWAKWTAVDAREAAGVWIEKHHLSGLGATTNRPIHFFGKPDAFAFEVAPPQENQV